MKQLTVILSLLILVAPASAYYQMWWRGNNTSSDSYLFSIDQDGWGILPQNMDYPAKTEVNIRVLNDTPLGAQSGKEISITCNSVRSDNLSFSDNYTDGTMYNHTYSLLIDDGGLYVCQNDYKNSYSPFFIIPQQYKRPGYTDIDQANYLINYTVSKSRVVANTIYSMIEIFAMIIASIFLAIALIQSVNWCYTKVIEATRR